MPPQVWIWQHTCRQFPSTEGRRKQIWEFLVGSCCSQYIWCPKCKSGLWAQLCVHADIKETLAGQRLQAECVSMRCHISQTFTVGSLQINCTEVSYAFDQGTCMVQQYSYYVCMNALATSADDATYTYTYMSKDFLSGWDHIPPEWTSRERMKVHENGPAGSYIYQIHCTHKVHCWQLLLAAKYIAHLWLMHTGQGINNSNSFIGKHAYVCMACQPLACKQQFTWMDDSMYIPSMCASYLIWWSMTRHICPASCPWIYICACSHYISCMFAIEEVLHTDHMIFSSIASDTWQLLVTVTVSTTYTINYCDIYRTIYLC